VSFITAAAAYETLKGLHKYRPYFNSKVFRYLITSYNSQKVYPAPDICLGCIFALKQHIRML